MAGLSELDKRILAFEQSWWQFPGAKEREILEVFGMPVTRYYQLLNALIDRPEASEFDPVLVARLRRQRSRRHGIRSARPEGCRGCPRTEPPVPYRGTDGPSRRSRNVRPRAGRLTGPALPADRRTSGWAAWRPPPARVNPPGVRVPARSS